MMLSFLWGGLLIILVWFSGLPVKCMVDTGSVQTIVDTTTFEQLLSVQAIMENAEPLRKAQLIGLGGDKRTQVIVVPIYRAYNVGIQNQFGWLEVDIAVAPDGWLPQPCLLGTDIMARQPILFDWEHQQLIAVRVNRNE